MSDDKKIPLIEYHFINPVKYTSLDLQKDTILYVNKLTACNISIIINILCIVIIRTATYVLDLLYPDVAIKLAILIAITVTAYIFLSCLIIVNLRLTHIILTISKHNNHINKIFKLLIILIVVELSLYILYYAVSSYTITIILYGLSLINLIFICIVMSIEVTYINT